MKMGRHCRGGSCGGRDYRARIGANLRDISGEIGAAGCISYFSRGDEPTGPGWIPLDCDLVKLVVVSRFRLEEALTHRNLETGREPFVAGTPAAERRSSCMWRVSRRKR